MYGIVNKGIRDMVTQNYGDEVWQKIRNQAQVEEDFFTSMVAYDDSITYDLVGAASSVLGASPHDILVAYGKFWITFTATQGYGNLLGMAGKRFPEFLSNLDSLHVRVGSVYRNLKPPSFSCEEIDDETLRLQYRSHREGLSSLVIGLLQGLGERFDVEVEISHVKKRQEEGFDEFMLKYYPKNRIKTTPENVAATNDKIKCPFSQH